MKKIAFVLVLPMLFTMSSYAQKNDALYIKQETIDKAVKALKDSLGNTQETRINKGVRQTAALWQQTDGTANDFVQFCKDSYIADEVLLDKTFNRVSYFFESLIGNYARINIDLKRPLHVDMGEALPVDMMFGSYDPSSHLTDDLYGNKIAFVVTLNFPTYSLKEKMQNADKWDSRQWAYARLGDQFISRVPADLQLKLSEAFTVADSYIADYNIYMGNLVDKKGKTLFPADLKLISHWGLRDEIKSNYADKKVGLDKQRMIYEVMKRIITQEIPEKVVNSNKYQWDPIANKLYENKKIVEAQPEPNARYQQLLNLFRIDKSLDPYNPLYPTQIQRSFDQNMEIPQEEVEKLFVELVSSPLVKEVAQLIGKRLGRNLEPFDIWYDGFKSRSSISETELDAKTMSKYPNREAFVKDLPNIMVNLGFTMERAKEITSKIEVDASRGAGHAIGAETKNDVAHLRTRISANGMNYKGYNIAVHEFGHTVEQTITLHDVDYYMMKGVPTTAFTEALAFVFQRRDLELLGYKNDNPDAEYLRALDSFWSAYEIMGVSLVDMQVWKWLYAHPDANAQQLKEAVNTIAKDVWNKYYAPVFGVKDQPILAIYSHMIDAPLYLSAYPVGHLIEFQIEKQIKGKNIANEIQRMYSKGRLIPQLWMKKAVGKEISNEPLFEAVKESLKSLK